MKFPRGQRAVVAVIESIRKEAGLTRRDLSLKLKESHSYVSRIERMQRDVTITEGIAIAKACGVEPLEFFRRILRG